MNSMNGMNQQQAPSSSMASGKSVGEVFTATGAIFNKLSDIYVTLQPLTISGAEYTDAEYKALTDINRKNQEDMQKISQNIKNRVAMRNQARTKDDVLKEKLMRESGVKRGAMASKVHRNQSNGNPTKLSKLVDSRNYKNQTRVIFQKRPNNQSIVQRKYLPQRQNIAQQKILIKKNNNPQQNTIQQQRIVQDQCIDLQQDTVSQKNVVPNIDQEQNNVPDIIPQQNTVPNIIPQQNIIRHVEQNVEQNNVQPNIAVQPNTVEEQITRPAINQNVKLPGISESFPEMSNTMQFGIRANSQNLLMSGIIHPVVADTKEMREI